LINFQSKDDVYILSLEGSILHKDSEALREYFEGMYENKITKIVLDMTKTHHICSSALGHMVYMENRLRSIGGEIKLVVNDEDLLELLDITLLNQVFLIYKSNREAIASFQ
jgi:anti-sigma B factor antagonist